MAANNGRFNPSPSPYSPYRRQDDEAPSLPLQYSSLTIDRQPSSPRSPTLDTSPLFKPPSNDSDQRYYGAGSGGRQLSDDSGFFGGGNGSGKPSTKGRVYSDEIPLRENPQRNLVDDSKELPKEPTTSITGDNLPAQVATGRPRERRRRPREPEKKKGFWDRKITWVVYTMTLIQCTVFIVELVKNSILTSSPIEIHPQINPMLGPSFSVLVNMGARYVPCMKTVPGVPMDTKWPCPNTTSSDPTNPTNRCSISELCGFQDFGQNPNQWFRFITPMFLHAGFIHIGFNMLLQLTLGREMEKTIGSIRFLIVYLSSGIFGFVLGGNFAATGIASTGASGALFGLIAINLLDLLYTWQERVSPKIELAFIVLDIAVSFVLGLLPGLDNFSHIGGFLMGLILGVCLLHSPNLLRRERVRVVPEEPMSENPTAVKKPSRKRARRVSYKTFAKDPVGFFKGRKALWWAWWLIRAGALIAVLACFVVLLNNFYKYHNTCSWCSYLTCLHGVNHWCDMGNLTQQLSNSNASSKRDLFGMQLTDLSEFF